MSTITTPPAALPVLAKIGAKVAVRCGASGPNNALKRGAWKIDGRTATPHEARALNAVEPDYGMRVYEAEPGAWSASNAA